MNKVIAQINLKTVKIIISNIYQMFQALFEDLYMQLAFI